MSKAIITKSVATLPAIALNVDDYVLVSDVSESGIFSRVPVSSFSSSAFDSYTVVTIVGDPGSDSNLPTEQAVREAIAAIVDEDSFASWDRDYADLISTPDIIFTNLVANGHFTTDTAGWSQGSAGSVISVDSGKLLITSSTETTPSATQTISGLVSGDTYKFEFYVSPGSGGAGVTLSNATWSNGSGTTSPGTLSSIGVYEFTFVATSTTAALRLSIYGSSPTGYYDNVKIYKVETAETLSGLWTGSGTYLKADGTLGTPEADGIMVYPASGVARSTGTGWTTSYSVGVGPNNLVQLNAFSQLPAVSAALLTNFPILNQSTSGNAANITGIAAIANGGTGESTANAARNALGVTPILGIGLTDTTLGTFTGTTIPDSQTVKQALQALESALEAFDTDFLRATDNATISGDWTFTGTVTGGSGLPAGGTTGQILMMTESGPAWVDLADTDIVTSAPAA